MQILEISPQKINSYSNINKRLENNRVAVQKTTETPAKLKMASLPSTSQYLAFAGGYSESLAETIERLDSLKTKYPNVYPPRVRELAQKILNEGNKTNETLISVHKKAYEGLLDCVTLEEAVEKFDEFKSVVPAKTVTVRENSLIADFNEGTLDYFDTDEDLSLQLLKLYWAKGFSMRDLKAYANGRDMIATVRKLNIPMVYPTYGQVLKLSDSAYKERLYNEMQKRRLAKADRLEQERSGEPVYIKRGKLTQTHRQHISEGLKRYFEAHPEAILTMSERQKQFYIDNPRCAVIIHRVMKKVWSLGSSDEIKNAMSNFMKKHQVAGFVPQILDTPEQMSLDASSMLQKFWTSNEWAKKLFSKNMTFAWKKIKEEEGKLYDLAIAPKGFVSRLQAWASAQGIEVKSSSYYDKFSPNDDKIVPAEGFDSELCERFMETLPGGRLTVSRAYALAILRLKTEFSQLKSKKSDAGARELCTELVSEIEKFQNATQGETTTAELKNLFTSLRCKAITDFKPKLAEMMESVLDNAFAAELKRVSGNGVDVAFHHTANNGNTPSIKFADRDEINRRYEYMRKFGTIF